jgi:hypothetical protein
MNINDHLNALTKRLQTPVSDSEETAHLRKIVDQLLDLEVAQKVAEARILNGLSDLLSKEDKK